MWTPQRSVLERFTKFFLVALSHENLVNYYNTNFQLMQHHNYSLTELDNMMPWEREIYIAMLIEHLQKKTDKLREKDKGY